MTKSVFSENYTVFRRLLITARKKAGVTQAELAFRLVRPQSYVSKYERGERRLDIVELLEIAETLQIDVGEFIADLRERIERPGNAGQI